MKRMNFEIDDRKEIIDDLNKKLRDAKEEIKSKILKMSDDLFQNQSSRSTRLLTSELIKNNFGMNFWEEAKKQIEAKSKELVDTYRKTYTWVTGEELDPV